MKKYLAIFILVLASLACEAQSAVPTLAPTLASLGNADLPKWTVTADTLNVRYYPAGEVVKDFWYTRGDVVNCLASELVDSTVWCNTGKGWVSAKWLK